jgi:hypothetical protein
MSSLYLFIDYYSFVKMTIINLPYHPRFPFFPIPLDGGMHKEEGGEELSTIAWRSSAPFSLSYPFSPLSRCPCIGVPSHHRRWESGSTLLFLPWDGRRKQLRLCLVHLQYRIVSRAVAAAAAAAATG